MRLPLIFLSFAVLVCIVSIVESRKKKCNTDEDCFPKICRKKGHKPWGRCGKPRCKGGRYDKYLKKCFCPKYSTYIRKGDKCVCDPGYKMTKKRCERGELCKYGGPLPDVFCGRGGQTCPRGYTCNIAEDDSYAVCCPDETPNPCKYDDPLQGVYCGRGGESCPPSYTCEIDPADRYAVCCPDKTLNMCKHGNPLQGVYCGRGGQSCPRGYTCEIDPADRHAVCCPDKICKYGEPLQGIQCGRGGQRCPGHYYCEIAPDDRYAVCCKVQKG